MLCFDVKKYGIDTALSIIEGVGVYCLKTTDGKYLYIGQSMHLKTRLYQHKKWMNMLLDNYDLGSICIIHCDCEDAALLERRAIEYHKPHFNVEYNRPEDYFEMRLMIPPFIAFKVQEIVASRAINCKEKELNKLASEGFEHIINKYTKRVDNDKNKEKTTVV